MRSLSSSPWIHLGVKDTLKKTLLRKRSLCAIVRLKAHFYFLDLQNRSHLNPSSWAGPTWLSRTKQSGHRRENKNLEHTLHNLLLLDQESANNSGIDKHITRINTRNAPLTNGTSAESTTIGTRNSLLSLGNLGILLGSQVGNLLESAGKCEFRIRLEGELQYHHNGDP